MATMVWSNQCGYNEKWIQLFRRSVRGHKHWKSDRLHDHFVPTQCAWCHLRQNVGSRDKLWGAKIIIWNWALASSVCRLRRKFTVVRKQTTQKGRMAKRWVIWEEVRWNGLIREIGNRWVEGWRSEGGVTAGQEGVSESETTGAA